LTNGQPLFVHSRTTVLPAKSLRLTVFPAAVWAVNAGAGLPTSGAAKAGAATARAANAAIAIFMSRLPFQRATMPQSDAAREIEHQGFVQKLRQHLGVLARRIEKVQRHAGPAPAFEEAGDSRIGVRPVADERADAGVGKGCGDGGGGERAV